MPFASGSLVALRVARPSAHALVAAPCGLRPKAVVTAPTLATDAAGSHLTPVHVGPLRMDFAAGDNGHALAIAVVLQDERCKILEHLDTRWLVHDHWEELDVGWLLPSLRDPQYPMLGNVDPYGNTTFNGLQVDLVEGELERLALSNDKPACAELLRRLKALCERCRDEPIHLVFVGD
jgi:hypothetical protein